MYDFAALFKYIQRGKLIGQLTGGSTGEPISFALPGGAQLVYVQKGIIILMERNLWAWEFSPI
jgi:hypothetical protein